MHKLVIMIEPLEDWTVLEARWPEFLRLVEAMPGLVRESTSHVERFLFGVTPYSKIHELFFPSLQDCYQAMTSMPGEAAGRLLQLITGGRMALFVAEHKEDDLAHIQDKE